MHLLTSNRVFLYYQGESTIFNKGNLIASKEHRRLLRILEKKLQQIKRQMSTQGEGGLYKKHKIPTLHPKLPRSGVVFHFSCEFVDKIFTSIML